MFKKRIGSIVKKKKGNQEAPMAAVVVSETSADDGEEIGEDREEEGTEVALEEPDDGDKEGRGTEGAPSETQAQVEIDDDDDTEDDEEEDNEEEEDTEDEEEGNTEAELSEVQAQEEPDDAVDNDSDDILQMLEDMEIPEFELSEDEGGIDEEEEEEEDVVEAEPETRQTFELVDWAARARREEIYSKRYRPTKAERKEFKEMAAMLGVASSKGMLGMALRSTTAIGQGMENTDNIHTLFFGGTSIMLKYGFVEWNENACGLILCTDGFALTYRNFNSYNPLEKRYETCQFWTSVDFCEKLDSKSFAIQLKSGQRYEFKVVEDGGDLGSWLKVLEKTLVQFHLHKGEASFTETLGWQYKVIHKAGYSAAVTGDLDILGKSSKLNKLDTYNELAPLHYAVQQEEYNIQVIAALLEKGADPNFQDYDGRSAMYYAERNESADIVKLLEQNGGTASKLAEVEARGELFASAEEANRKTEHRREVEKLVKDQQVAEANAKAQSVQNKMNQNMAALKERGEKIEQMGETAQEMQNEAKNYADMAALLKEKVKKKKWYQL